MILKFYRIISNILNTTILAGVLSILSCGNSEVSNSQPTPQSDSLAKDSVGPSPVKDNKPFPFILNDKVFRGEISEGLLLHIECKGDPKPCNKINHIIDSTYFVFAEEDVRYLWDPPLQNDSNLIKIRGFSYVEYLALLHFENMISTIIISDNFGKRVKTQKKSLNFDLETGNLIELESIFTGGFEGISSFLKAKNQKFDQELTYDCALEIARESVSNFLIREDGIRWIIQEDYFPDRKFCRGMLDFVVSWKDLKPIMDETSLVYKRVQRANFF